VIAARGDRPRRSIGPAASVALLAVVAYAPLLLTAPGRASVDTKVHLYLDPGRLLERAVSMWDPHVGLGTVPHQQLGYLLPMGPFFWLADAAGLPDWVAQRLWLGSLLFAAGLGARFLGRTLGWGSTAATTAGLVYLLSPYALHYAAKHSIILAAWSGLPWLIALTIRAVRRCGWKDAAWFAIVVQLVGGVNATALVLVGLGPLLWLVHAVWAAREASVRRALGAAARIGALTVATSLWWVAGLWVQGRYGIDIVRYTETPEAVANASTAPEVLRQLGYWFFYGKDKFGPHVGAAALDYTQRPWLIVAGFVLTAVAFVAAMVVRWRHRAFVVLLLVTGFVLSVGAHPWVRPTPLGRVLRAFLSSDVGLAMRSMPRAMPLFALGLALALGAAVLALGRRLPRWGLPAAVAVLGLAAANQPGLFTGRFVAEPLSRPEEVPGYWYDVAAWLDANDDGTRVLELPGIDFASYRWGTTIDPVPPGLMDRPSAAREIVTYGTPPSADLLRAFDRRLQEGTLEPAAIAPIARLLRAGHLVLRNDLTYERYRTARPRPTTALVVGAQGLGDPVGFGGTAPNVPRPVAPLLDEAELGHPDLPDPDQVVVVPVERPVPIVRAAAVDHPIVVAADGEGLVDLAAAGLIDGDETIHYAADLAGDPDRLAAALDRGGVLVLTDTNRQRGHRWSTVRENHGYTEPAGERPLEPDSSIQNLALFNGAGFKWFTVAEHRGGATARASAYGNPVSLTPEDRPVNAIDGDPRTAWQTNAFAPTEGETLQIELDRPVTTDRVVLAQPFTGARNRWITRVALRLDGGEPFEVELSEASRTAAGQVVRFDRNRFSRLRIEVLADTAGRLDHYDGLSAVGFAEVGIEGVRADEVIRLPSGLLDAAGQASVDHDLAVVMTRERTDPANVVRSDEETHLARSFELPGRRSFALAVEGRVSDQASDEVVDGLIGRAPAERGGVTVRASSRLPGSLAAGGPAAVDGDPATAWQPAFLASEGAWVEVTAPVPIEFDRLDLDIVDDGRHSRPTRLRVDVDGEPPVVVDVPSAPAGAVPLPQRLRGRTIRVTVEAVRPVTTIDYYSEQPIALPIGIAELGIPGVVAAAPPATAPTDCRSGLLSVDGVDVPLAVDGPTDAMLDGAPVALRPCGPAAGGLELGDGRHDIRTAAPGRESGFDVDRIVLRSEAGGDAGVVDGPLVGSSGAAGPPAEVGVSESSATAMRVDVRGARPGHPIWLELGQSFTPGWRASIAGRQVDGPVLLDGFANGWLVDPPAAEFGVDLRFTPQRVVWVALAVSAGALLLCLALALWPRAGPATPPLGAEPDPPDIAVTDPWAYPRTAPAPRLRVGVLCGLTLGTFVVAGALVALVTGVLAGVALWWRRGRPLLLLGSPAAVLATGLAVAAGQVVFAPPVGLQWPTLFEPLHRLGWLAVSLLVAEVSVAWVWRRAAAPRPAVRVPPTRAAEAEASPVGVSP
jgi:arabinofuranan 3-O-arabinosyltransferase